MRKLNILATAKSRGSVNVLVPVVTELRSRGHNVCLYATGNDTEAAGFSGKCQMIKLSGEQYADLVRGFEVVITGVSENSGPDGHFIRAARSQNIPVIALQDQDACYLDRLGNNPEHFPTKIAVMNEGCLDTIVRELGTEAGSELARKAVVVGWAAFDNFARLRKNFTEEDRINLLKKLGLNPDNPVYFHATQNIHHMSNGARGAKILEEPKWFDYETRVTGEVFRAASELGKKLIVKPHPKEEFDFKGYEKDRERSTRELAKRYGVFYIDPKACDSRELMLASNSVSAGRSTCLAEGCLLGKNTGGILPEVENLEPYPPVVLGAIPYATDWKSITQVIGEITSNHPDTNIRLAEMRKKFYVDGNASKRIADLVESL